MKKKILILGTVLALVSVLVFAMPLAVSAASTGTQTFSGNLVGSTIDIVVPTISSSFGTFKFGDNVLSSSDSGTVTVTFNSQSPKTWSVTAYDHSAGANNGHMVFGTTPLTNAFDISTDGIGWYNSASGDGLTYGGTVASGPTYSPTAPLPFHVMQNISSSDTAPGTYSITITFTGSLGF
ncbi:MAG: hypothetical protein WCC72_11320 [Dehalococcoidales bacterium]